MKLNPIVNESASCSVASDVDNDLNHKFERLWRTDFQDCIVDTKVCPSIEERKALEMMEESLKRVDGHY